MKENKEVEYKNFIKMQRRGKQKVRFMLFLFLFFLIASYSLGYFLLSDIVGNAIQDKLMFGYLWRALLAMFLWLCIIRSVWNYHKAGRWLFLLGAIVSFYSVVDCIALMNGSSFDQEASILNIVFITLVMIKNIGGLACAVYLVRNEEVLCIWDEFRVDNEEQEEEEVEFREILQSLEHVISDDSKLAMRAKKYLRRYTTFLIIYLYSALILIYLFLAVMILSSDDPGLPYIQRTILIATLFSIFVWSLPAVCMFMYKQWAKYCIPLAWALEVGRFILFLPTLYNVFTTQRYGAISMLLYFLIEVCRYALFIKLTLSISRNPYITTYWSKKMQNNESYR